MWSFRPKVDLPEVASPVLKVDSTDDKQHSTTPLIKMLFAWIILPPLLK